MKILLIVVIVILGIAGAFVRLYARQLGHRVGRRWTHGKSGHE
jgi:hypothetical protein